MVLKGSGWVAERFLDGGWKFGLMRLQKGAVFENEGLIKCKGVERRKVILFTFDEGRIQ